MSERKVGPKDSLCWIERFLWILALTLLLVPAMMWAESLVYQHYLNRSFDEYIAAETVTAKSKDEVGRTKTRPKEDANSRKGQELPSELVGRIQIESLDLSAIVQAGVDDTTLRRGVGHLTSSALPGQPGNVVLAAHRDTFFRSLEWIEEGDIISLETPYDRYSYQVSWTAVVKPGAVDVLEPTSENSVTLITCYPFTYVGAAPERFIVRAHQVAHEQDR